jgi:betaine-homocysteine S-methyltransferase
MLPMLKKLRKNVNCYIAAQPVPYATSKEYPAFQFLKYDRKSAHPLYMELDRFACTRYEMAHFAKEAEELGVNYIGICCGAGPHHVRSMAEALGRVVPASKYSPDMSQHGLLGDGKVVKKHEKKFLKKWK